MSWVSALITLATGVVLPTFDVYSDILFAVQMLTFEIHDVYQKFVQNKAHAYLILFISPKCDKHMAFTNILLNALGPMLSHHESSDEE